MGNWKENLDKFLKDFTETIDTEIIFLRIVDDWRKHLPKCIDEETTNIKLEFFSVQNVIFLHKPDSITYEQLIDVVLKKHISEILDEKQTPKYFYIDSKMEFEIVAMQVQNLNRQYKNFISAN